MLEIWAKLASYLGSCMIVWQMLNQFIPYELRSFIEKRLTHLYSKFQPYVEVKILERSGEHLKCNEAYTAVQSYLSTISFKSAKRFIWEIGRDERSVMLIMDKDEQVEDEFRGVKVCWVSGACPNGVSPHQNSSEQAINFYKVIFQQKHRNFADEYLKYVVKKGNEIRVNNRQRKLYTNVGRHSFFSSMMWSHIPFEHPATFETLAMDPDKKSEIKDDLVKFTNSKDFYARIGKAWKRGYLLYGPPGTGKSTMIAAMANFLKYDVFDLELTAVHDNTELRRLLIETTSKSIIVIEDIDCSLKLTGQRKKDKNQEDQQSSDDKDLGDEGDKKASDKAKKAGNNTNNVTLSGLLNVIDGIWSSCGGERIIVFTTNHVEKLDPALIRKGRMDKHIKMSYCDFQGFKVLAKNYLSIEQVSDDTHNYHEKFDEIKKLLSEVKITPADVAETLMPKSIQETADQCLQNLIRVLEEAKEVKGCPYFGQKSKVQFNPN